MTSDRFKVAFQSTPSAWRETVRLSQHIKIFPVFQSTPSAWRETSDGLYFLYTNVSFQSTPSAWRETLPVIRIRKIRSDISIHSLRMEGDGIRCLLILLGKYFNPLPPHGGRLILRVLTRTRNRISIHSLRMEGDLNSTFPVFHVVKFQSTPSAWRETAGTARTHIAGACISIHSLRMEGDTGTDDSAARLYISIHSLRMEGDRRAACSCFVLHISIHSLRMEGDRRNIAREIKASVISIHSLRMEGDRRTVCDLREHRNFNPLPPHGGRRKSKTGSSGGDTFQSTPSAWRETYKNYCKCRRCLEFQSTPSAWRETVRFSRLGEREYNFNPLPPHGGRLEWVAAFLCGEIISIHSLRMEGDS